MSPECGCFSSKYTTDNFSQHV